MNEAELMQFLDQHNLPYERVDHPPVYTCDEAERLRPDMSGISTKNLFMCDKKARQFYLVVTACEKRMDIEKLSAQLSVPHLRFGSETNLERLLGVTRGAVTLLGLVNDTENSVALWIDRDIWQAEEFLCHPLVNNATLVLSKETLLKIFEITGHTVNIFDA